jgi:hypothetical protein
MNQQQQDPNALTNLVNVLLITKLMGSRPGLEGALLISMLLNTNNQQTTPPGTLPIQANLLPLLLLMGMGREEGESYRGRWRGKDQERDKDADGPRAN